jgi:hypothetical protein
MHQAPIGHTNVGSMPLWAWLDLYRLTASHSPWPTMTWSVFHLLGTMRWVAVEGT